MIISKVIKSHGYTIEKVAEAMGVKRGSLANMIGGNPTVETLQRIADVIGCKRSEFFADEVEETPPQTPTFKCPKCGATLAIDLRLSEVSE